MNRKKKIIIAIASIGIISSIIVGKNIISERIEEKRILEQEENNRTLEKNTMPEFCNLYESPSDIYFVDSKDLQYKLSDLKGNIVIIMFWNNADGTTNYKLDDIRKFQNVLSKYDDVKFILVDRTDEEILRESNIAFPLAFDKISNAYYKFQIDTIPSTLIINKNGSLIKHIKEMISDNNELESLIEYGRDGGYKATENFVRNKLTNSSGGIKTTLLNENQDNIKETILSESQGIVLEYAALTNDEELFKTTLDYINKYMKNDELVSWRVQHNNASRVNAAIDDLRIYGALKEGYDKFGKNTKELRKYRKAIYKYNVEDGNLVDSYDFEYNQKAERLTLCYADFKVLEELSESDRRFNKVYKNSFDIVKNGYISDEFPLYYSWYNYKTKKYEKDDLNTAEAMVTLLHLAEQGELKQNTISWLKDTIKKDGILGKYTVVGNVVDGYEYESTAVYAIVALIGNEIDDRELIDLAVNKMEKMRINNSTSEFNGGFGNPDGTGIYSFDQCMALLTYGSLDNKVEN